MKKEKQVNKKCCKKCGTDLRQRIKEGWVNEKGVCGLCKYQNKLTTKMPQNTDWFKKFLKKIPEPEIKGIILSKKDYNKIKKLSTNL